MAVDGSFWEGLPAVSPRASRSTSNFLDGKRIGGSTDGIWPVRGSFAVWRGPRRHDHRRQSSARNFPAASIYNIRGFAEFVNAPTPICAPILVADVNADRTYEYFQNFILEILARTAINSNQLISCTPCLGVPSAGRGGPRNVVERGRKVIGKRRRLRSTRFPRLDSRGSSRGVFLLLERLQSDGTRQEEEAGTV
jgi:hypothetical protein